MSGGGDSVGGRGRVSGSEWRGRQCTRGRVSGSEWRGRQRVSTVRERENERVGSKCVTTCAVNINFQSCSTGVVLVCLLLFRLLPFCLRLILFRVYH